MIRNDSVLCAGCGREFTMPLVEMVRRRHRWCDECLRIADQKLSEAVIRAGAGLPEESEGVDEG
jgi:hypothetical protein